MPNWAEGTLKVRGTKENILNFLRNEMLGDIKHTFGVDEQGEPIAKIERKAITTTESDYDFKLECKGGFYIKGTRRAFIENNKIEFDFYDEDIEKLEISGFKQAWGVAPENFIPFSKKYDLDIKIFAFERGMEFTQEIEITKGKITKDLGKEYDDYFWEVPFAEIGG